MPAHCPALAEGLPSSFRAVLLLQREPSLCRKGRTLVGTSRWGRLLVLQSSSCREVLLLQRSPHFAERQVQRVVLLSTDFPLAMPSTVFYSNKDLQAVLSMMEQVKLTVLLATVARTDFLVLLL